uniref:Uncharacterized protein n=1 Tax=Peronospora matthiolae TaxID=2874970 RepID=A0AAV1UJV9_9STRA
MWAVGETGSICGYRSPRRLKPLSDGCLRTQGADRASVLLIQLKLDGMKCSDVSKRSHLSVKRWALCGASLPVVAAKAKRDMLLSSACDAHSSHEMGRSHEPPGVKRGYVPDKGGSRIEPNRASAFFTQGRLWV